MSAIPQIVTAANNETIFTYFRGSNPGGAIFSAPVQTGPRANPDSCTMGTGSFPGVRCCRGVTLTPHPPTSAGV